MYTISSENPRKQIRLCQQTGFCKFINIMQQTLEFSNSVNADCPESSEHTSHPYGE
jgi:hypothetical protein